MKLQGGSGGGERAGRAWRRPWELTRIGPPQRGRGEDGEGRGREEALETGREEALGGHLRDTHFAAAMGTGAGETPKSPSRPDTLSPTSPVRSNWTQINGHAGNFQKRRNLYQVGAGAVSTVSTNIYTYLHRLQSGSRVVYTATAGRAGGGGATRSRGEQ